MFSAQLAKHLKHKERYPEDAANEMRKKRSCLALDTGIGPRLTREQYFDATKEYDIPEPPDYPQDGLFKRPSWSHNYGDRLEAWARCDPTKEYPDNPLRSSRGAGYWRRHDPACRMSNHPHRNPVEASSGSSSAVVNDSIEASSESLTRTRRVRKLTGKGRVWANEEGPTARALKRARTESPPASPVKRRGRYRKKIQKIVKVTRIDKGLERMEMMYRVLILNHSCCNRRFVSIFHV